MGNRDPDVKSAVEAIKRVGGVRIEAKDRTVTTNSDIPPGIRRLGAIDYLKRCGWKHEVERLRNSWTPRR